MWNLKATIQLWPTSASPWHYIEIPTKIVKEVEQFPLDRGLKKVTAKIGDYSWHTSILPAGKGKKILPIKAKVRQDLELSLGDSISIELKPIDL